MSLDFLYDMKTTLKVNYQDLIEKIQGKID